MRRARSPQRRRMGPRGSGSAAISAATRAGMAAAAVVGIESRSDPMQLLVSAQEEDEQARERIKPPPCRLSLYLYNL